MTARGLNHAQAIAYVGVKRRTFDTLWRPRLVAMPQGSSLVFDRADLDRLFDEFKQQACGAPQAANDAGTEVAHNGARNGRPINPKGEQTWANQPGESTPTTTPGKSTSGGAVRDFASVASRILAKQKAG